MIFQFLPYEQTTMLQLIKTDNKIFNKIITVLASLCGELEVLKYEAENKFYNALMYYGEGEPEEGLQEGEAQIQIGRIIPLLQVRRGDSCIRYILHLMPHYAFT